MKSKSTHLSPANSLDGAIHIDELCDEFEARWRREGALRLEEYWERIPRRHKSAALVELLAIEVRLRIEAGEKIDEDEHYRRFPDYPEEVAAVFARLSHCKASHTHQTRTTVPLVKESAPGQGTALAPAGSPQTLGRFELLEQLGIGAFGVVWKAQDTQLRRTVVVKVPLKQRLRKAEHERFLREARAAARLRHPHIVSVHEVGTEAGSVYIVSEFVEGRAMDEWLTDSRPTLRQAVALLRTIAEAVHDAHEKGVVHRDLKPSNILIDASGAPHILDFGLAKQAAETETLTIEGDLLGTPAYMSPEQARGEGKEADRRTDIYSLGVILFELLTSERPFRGSTQMLLKQVVEQEPPRPRSMEAGVPRDLETICLRCLEKQPGHRFSTAGELAEELERFQRGQPIRSRPVGPLARTARWCRRNRLATSLLAVCLLTLATLAASVAYRAQARASQVIATTRQYDSLISKVPERIVGRRPGWTWRAIDELEQAARLNTPVKNDVALRSLAARCFAAVDLRQKTTLAQGMFVVDAVFGPQSKRLAVIADRKGSSSVARIYNAATGAMISEYRLSEPDGSIGSEQLTATVAPTNISILLQQPVIYTRFDAASGVTLVDQSGNNNHGLLSGEVALGVEGALPNDSNPALEFRGGTAHFSAPQINTSAGAQNTVCFWIKCDGKPIRGYCRPFSLGDGGYCLIRQDGAFGVSTGNGDVLGVDSAPLANRWVHVAAIFTNGDVDQCRLFIDGRQVEVQHRRNNPKNSDAVATQSLRLNRNFFSGQVDEFAVFNRALTSDEIADQTGIARMDWGFCKVVFSPDGCWLLVGTLGGRIHCWDTNSKAQSPICSWNAHGRKISALGFSPDGRFLITAAKENEPVKRWSMKRIARGETMLPLPSPQYMGGCLAFSPDRQRVAIANKDENLLVSSDLSTLYARWPGGNVAEQIFGLDGRTLLQKVFGDMLVVCDPLSGKAPFAVHLREEFIQYWKINAILPQREGLVVATGSAGNLGLVELASKRKVVQMACGRGYPPTAVSPSGDCLAVVGENKTVLYEVHAGEVERVTGHGDGIVRAMDLSANGKMLATLEERVEDTRSVQTLVRLRDYFTLETLDSTQVSSAEKILHQSTFASFSRRGEVAFHADGKSLAFGSSMLGPGIFSTAPDLPQLRLAATPGFRHSPVVIEENQFRLLHGAKIVDDARAGNGKAVRLEPGAPLDQVWIEVPFKTAEQLDAGVIFAVIRAEESKPHDPAWVVGLVEEGETRRQIVPSSEFPNSGYHFYRFDYFDKNWLQKHPRIPLTYFFQPAKDNPRAPTIWIDRLVIFPITHPAWPKRFVAIGDHTPLCFSPLGEKLWGVLEKRRVVCWSWPGLKPSTHSSSDFRQAEESRIISSLAVSDEHVLVGLERGGVAVLSAEDGRRLETWDLGGGVITSLTMNNSCSLAAIGMAGGFVELRTVPSGTLVAQVDAHPLPITALAFGRRDDQLLSGSVDKSLIFWKRTAAGLEKVMALDSFPKPIHQIRHSPKNRTVALLLKDETAVRIWDLDRLNRRFREHHIPELPWD